MDYNLWIQRSDLPHRFDHFLTLIEMLELLRGGYGRFRVMRIMMMFIPIRHTIPIPLQVHVISGKRMETLEKEMTAIDRQEINGITKVWIRHPDRLVECDPG